MAALLDRRKPGASLHPMLRRRAIGVAHVPDPADFDLLRRIAAGLRQLDVDRPREVTR